ncbi:MAG TPA: hypothetical protein VHZ07_27115 [Bryobacteraceae bacterium]|jgi:hypothetical protein|nr:hypothetical protein [Bryobacteraceae bacterium]
MALNIAGFRSGQPPSLPVLGYILFGLYLAFFIEAAMFLRPFQVTNEYSACQRITETGWCLLLGLVLIFRREVGGDISLFEIRILPLLSNLALLFAVVYVVVPTIAWTAAGRINDADIAQSINARENAQRQTRAIDSRVASATGLGELNQTPGLMSLLPAGTNRNDLAAVKSALTAAASTRESQIVNQNLAELKSRQFIRTTQTNRLIAQCGLILIGCLWIWWRTKSLKFDVDLELA